MKRSRTASLFVMGLTPLLISACDETQKSQQAFTTLDNCAEAGVPKPSCETAYNQAMADAPKSAPHYSTREQCAESYDNDTCQEDDGAPNGPVWYPAMNGFLIGRVVRNGVASFFPAGPVFRRRDDTNYSPHYGSVYAGGSGGWRSTSSDASAGEGDTVSRGGFGGGEGEGGEGGHGE